MSLTTTIEPWGPPPAEPERQVLLVSGSPRRRGNTDTILSQFAEQLSAQGIPTQTVRLADMELHPCTGCELCRTSGRCTRFTDGMTELYPVIEKSRGLVMASPTYNYTVTPEIKTFIDRLYPYFDFTEPRPGPYVARLANHGRKLVAIGICEQEDPSEMRYNIPVMVDAMQVVGYDVVAELPITGHFERGSVANDAGALQRVRDTADILAAAL